GRRRAHRRRAAGADRRARRHPSPAGRRRRAHRRRESRRRARVGHRARGWGRRACRAAGTVTRAVPGAPRRDRVALHARARRARRRVGSVDEEGRRLMPTLGLTTPAWLALLAAIGPVLWSAWQ